MRGIRPVLCLVVLLAPGLAACGSDDASPASADAPSKVGAWKPWTLESPGEIRVPPPPERAVKERARPGYAVEPWLNRAMELVARRPKDPVTASRAYAIVAVAMADAAIAAAHWQERYDRKDHPSTAGAMAVAGSRAIAYAFPEYPAARLDADAEQLAADRAGLELGRAVAQRTIAVARRDGSDRPWRGTVPRAKGSWRPPPGSAARPVSPGAGDWRPWVLESGDAVRPPAPPPYGSKAFRDEAQAVLDTHRSLTDRQKRIAEFWAGGDGTELPPGRWIKVTLAYLRDRPPMSEARVARLFALLNVAMSDAGIAAWDAKYEWWVTRPENAIRDLGLDPDFEPYLQTPFFPAYVSGHAAYSGAAAEVLGYLFPEDEDIWDRRAKEAADSRVYGGIHYPMDGEGVPMGEQVGKLVVARARADGADG
jgi:hypothetical protein